MKFIYFIKASLTEKLRNWQNENGQLTREFCHNLLLQLKRKHLDPVLQQLQGGNGSELSFDDIIGVYYDVKADYDKQAVGAKDAIAATLFDFQEVCWAVITHKKIDKDLLLFQRRSKTFAMTLSQFKKKTLEFNPAAAHCLGSCLYIQLILFLPDSVTISLRVISYFLPSLTYFLFPFKRTYMCTFDCFFYSIIIAK